MSDEFCNFYQAMSEHTQCRLAIPYKSVAVRDNGGVGYNYPCWTDEVKSCPEAAYPTPEEIEARNANVMQAFAQFQSDLDNDICPHCKTPIQHWQQIGRCVYAEPCGDRLYQGRVPKGKK